MNDSYDLTKLGPEAFEHLVNSLAMRVLGAGHTGFGPGADGGRDGYFNGEATYPSQADRWSGVWYIQSKFHKPHLSKDAQKWLINQIDEELKLFSAPNSKRLWPDIWIVVTNIDPSGTPETGSFDKAFDLVKTIRPKLAPRFHIWGGRKILDFLRMYPDVANHYGHFLTPGHIIAEMYAQFKDERVGVESILRYFIVRQFEEQQYTRLEQAGSDTEARPGIHKLFIDLPFRAPEYDIAGFVTGFIGHAAARCHRLDVNQVVSECFTRWSRHPNRARVWFIKGGPGQGKSTVGQFYSQIQRAALILENDALRVGAAIKQLAREVKAAEATAVFWPTVPRIPIFVELRDYAHWFGSTQANEPRGILTYLSKRITVAMEQMLYVGTLKRALGYRSWIAILDGLDEVPDDVKDAVAREVKHFVHEIAIEANADLMAICTSRPQGYSGQFSDIDGPVIELSFLEPDVALNCAIPVIKFGRSKVESERDIQTLRSAIQSEPGNVRELMTTPLQSHIMAVVIREGGKPPDRRWQLFSNFYQVIKRRETNRDLPDRALARLLREDHQLLKTVHNRLGFVLHARAETSRGAQTSLDRAEFQGIIEQAVSLMIETDSNDLVQVLMRATTNRLVLVNTPDDGEHLRFDIRPLQEFFAAEFLYELVDVKQLRNRLVLISGDAHWREVMHFLLSALVENGRLTELDVATQSLTAIDQQEDDYNRRILSRRLAKGALIAARLLHEGVLEQDKRVRQQFQNCLEPIAGSLSYSALTSLSRIRQPSSLVWVLAFMFDRIREADKSENIGAAVILCILLPDSDTRCDEIKIHLVAAPTDYTLAVIRIYKQYVESSKITVPNWIQDVCLSMLLGESWRKLAALDFGNIIELLQSTIHPLAVAGRHSLTKYHTALLGILIKRVDPSNSHAYAFAEFGVLRIAHPKVDLCSGEIECGFLGNELPDECATAPGILQGIYKILRFADTRRPSDFTDVISFFSENLTNFAVLPAHIRAYTPINDGSPVETQFAWFSTMKPEDCAQFVSSLEGKSSQVGKVGSVAIVGGDCKLDQWRALVYTHLHFAFVIWCDFYWARSGRSRPNILDSGDAVDLLVTQLLKYPIELLASPLIWGRLFAKAPKREAELRYAIRKETKTDRNITANPNDECHVFALQLPDEASLLPYILANLTQDRSSLYSSEIGGQSVCAMIAQFVPNRSQLDGITENLQESRQIRACAFIMSCLHETAPDLLQKRAVELAEVWYPESPGWLLNAIVFCAARLEKVDEKAAERIVSQLLLKNRENYFNRMIIEQLLTDWRERSAASISTAGVQANWLAGTG